MLELSALLHACALMLELLVGMCLHGVLIALMSKGVNWASWLCNTRVEAVVSNQWTGLLDWTTGLTILPQKSIFR